MDFDNWQQNKKYIDTIKRKKLIFYFMVLCSVVVFFGANSLLYLLLCWWNTPYEIIKNESHCWRTVETYTVSFNPLNHPYVLFGQAAFNLLVGGVAGIIFGIYSQLPTKENVKSS